MRPSQIVSYNIYNILSLWPCTPSTINKTSRDTSYCAARARVSPPPLRVINWKRRLGPGRRWPPNKSKTCSCFRRNLPGRGDRPCAADNAARARVYHNIVVVLHEKLVLRGHRVRSGICAAVAADAKGFRVAARGEKTRTGTGTRPDSAGRWSPAGGGARSTVRRGGGPAWGFRFYLYTIRVWSDPLHNLLLLVSFTCTTRFRVLLAAPSSSSSSSLPSANRVSTDDSVPYVARNCTNNDIFI